VNGSLETPVTPRFAATFAPKALSGTSNTRRRVNEKRASFSQFFHERM